MSRRRIGVDARYIQDFYHGVGRYTYELVRHLPEVDGEDTFVVFWNPDVVNTRFDMGVPLGHDRVEAVVARVPLYAPQSQPAMAALAAKAQLDLFHGPFFGFPLLAPCPLVLTIHDLIFERYPEYMSIRWAYLYYRLVMQLGVARARAIAVVSESTQRDLARFYRHSRARVQVTPLAADDHFLPAGPEAIAQVRRRYDLPEDYILNVGSRRPNKNVGAIVRALSAIRERVPHSLICVGESDPRFPDELQEAVEETGLQARARAIGKVAEEDLPAVYSAASALVFPSLVEGFGAPVQEAMACNCPVITSDCSSLPEAAGGAALLVSPRDTAALARAMERVLTDVGLAERLRRLGQGVAAKRSWRHTAELTLSLYESVLAHSGSRLMPSEVDGGALRAA
ncbi:MAG TPA: glycosyltransferase family 1 protein [Chloroflexota bacterium]|nr:glycosyltransferase family 1 protein [Chloroflexota bacterium]